MDDDANAASPEAAAPPRGKRYKKQSFEQLKWLFRERLSVATIRAVWEGQHRHAFPESFRLLGAIDALAQNLAQEDGDEERVPRILQEHPYLRARGVDPILIQRARPAQRPRPPTEPTLRREFAAIPELCDTKPSARDDDDGAGEANKGEGGAPEDPENDDDQAGAKETEQQPPQFECGCCFGDFRFEDLCQCNEGHLFCVACVRSHAEDIVFGKGLFRIGCMRLGAPECPAAFSEPMLDKAIPHPQQRARIDDYIMRASVKEAQMEDASQCPKCAFVGTLPPDPQQRSKNVAGETIAFERVVRCLECRHVYCSLCSEPPHGQKTCEQAKAAKLETRKTNKRNAIEEAMSAAVVRSCPGCQRAFVKTDGCNKMTCPSCKVRSCYVCRQRIRDYSHFCRTAHCDHRNCGKCQLYTKWEEDDRRARREIALREQENAGENGEIAEDIAALLLSPDKKDPPSPNRNRNPPAPRNNEGQRRNQLQPNNNNNQVRPRERRNALLPPPPRNDNQVLPRERRNALRPLPRYNNQVRRRPQRQENNNGNANANQQQPPNAVAPPRADADNPQPPPCEIMSLLGVACCLLILAWAFAV